MLINDFYTCHDVVNNEHELSARIVFNAGHAIFNGHFPGQPVTPGVCMMEIVKELLQNQVGKSLMLHNARNVKFLQFVTPAMQPIAYVSWKESQAVYIVSASFSLESTVLFKLDGSYGPVIAGMPTAP